MKQTIKEKIQYLVCVSLFSILAMLFLLGAAGGSISSLMGWTGSEWERLRIDSSTHSTQTISYAHHEIHSGSHYTTCYNQLVSDTGDKSIIAFKTPNTTKYFHMLWSGSGSSATKFYGLIGPTITDNTGATLAVFNNNGNSANVSGAIDISQNPDLDGSMTYFTESTMGNVTGGSKATEVWLGAEKKKGGGQTRGESEFVLQPNMLHAFVAESLTADDNYHSICLSWYEHTDK